MIFYVLFSYWLSNSYDSGMPLTLIGESVFARCLSAQKDERVAASAVSALYLFFCCTSIYSAVIGAKLGTRLLCVEHLSVALSL